MYVGTFSFVELSTLSARYFCQGSLETANRERVPVVYYRFEKICVDDCTTTGSSTIILPQFSIPIQVYGKRKRGNFFLGSQQDCKRGQRQAAARASHMIRGS